MDSLKRVFILGHFEGAANNRTDLEHKGLLASGIDCVKINFLPKIRSRFLYPSRLFSSFKFLFTIKSSDVIIIYGESPFFVIDTFFLRFTKCKIVFERTEYPNYLIYNSGNSDNLLDKKSRFFLNNLKHASGFITCSDALINYYGQFLSKHVDVLKLPLLVDLNRFNKKYDNPLGYKYISYCGNMGNNKDGVTILIDAFKIIASEYPDINLVLIGDAPTEEMQNLKNQIKGYENRIIFTGAIKHDQMPKYLSSASILALARPNNKQAEGGFPSKLGEYLSTGNPVVVTKVGEIPLYIKDGENGFLSEPDSVDLFAERLKHVIDNGEEAFIVGNKGLELARHFDFPTQGLILKNYLQKI